MSDAEDKYYLEPDADLSTIDEELLSKIIVQHRDLPYTVKIERVDGNKVYCRNSWGNHIEYIFKEGSFFLPTE